MLFEKLAVNVTDYNLYCYAIRSEQFENAHFQYDYKVYEPQV